MITPWWLIKVVTGLWLVVDATIRQLEPREPWLAVPLPMWLGQGLVVAGALVWFWHYILLKRGADDLASPSQLVQWGGLFEFIRHPMYLGVLILYLGLTFMTGDGLSLIVYAGALAATLAQCREEDAQLARLFGWEFEEWKLRTRMLVPTRWRSRTDCYVIRNESHVAH